VWCGLLNTTIKKLTNLVGRKAIYSDPADCYAYGYDNSLNQVTPDAVVFPTTHEQVQAIVQTCYEDNVPLLARGRGSSTVGGAVPVKKGVVCSFERMNKIISFEPENRLVVTQCGVANQALQDHVASAGFFWPPDPSSRDYATIGGNLAYNSSGPRAIKYGTPRDHTLGLKAITGDGNTLKVGVKTTKGVVGYDLTRLLIGSEGTLGIITEATLKLTPIPEAKRTMALYYRDVTSAAEAVSKIMAQPVIPCGLEFMDTASIDMIREYSDVEMPNNAGAMLILELDGSKTQLEADVQAVLNAAKHAGLFETFVAKSNEQVKAIWATRKALSPALKNVAPKKINEDVVVPVANIPKLVARLQMLSEEFKIKIVSFGHIGNGNLHVNLMYDPANSEQNKNAPLCLEAVFDAVIELEGTLSGEHGIGLAKLPFVHKELSPQVLHTMRQIKQVFDPKGILNPGKIFIK
jgi:D-lactate dehydrogenase